MLKVHSSFFLIKSLVHSSNHLLTFPIFTVTKYRQFKQEQHTKHLSYKSCTFTNVLVNNCTRHNLKENEMLLNDELINKAEFLTA